MTTKKEGVKKSKKLDSISFRGEKDKWIDFQYAVKKDGNKNLWMVLESLVDGYIKKKNGESKK